MEQRLTDQAGRVENRLTARIDRFQDSMDGQTRAFDGENREAVQRLARLEALQHLGKE